MNEIVVRNGKHYMSIEVDSIKEWREVVVEEEIINAKRPEILPIIKHLPKLKNNEKLQETIDGYLFIITF